MMPTDWLPRTRRSKPTWKTMSRYQRKMFHRENESRRIGGLPPKNKP